MRDITVESINIRGESELLVADHQSVKTAFRKMPIEREEIDLGPEGFIGDIVKHTDVHGGNDKAVCCYNADRFPYWKNTLGFNLTPSAFGENLTLSGAAGLEENVFIGDRYRLGEAVVEVSEPRGPCFIIGIRYNYKKFPVHLQETGFTGFYLRTIIPGKVKKGDQLIQQSSHPEQISVMQINRIRYHDQKNKEWLQRLVTLQELTLEWREKFDVMLRKL
jgi:MOSC domain-containing protein YiiM